MVDFGSKCGSSSLNSIACADRFENDAFQDRGTVTKVSLGTFNVTEGYNNIVLDQIINLKNSDLIYVSGPVCADAKTETLFSDIHDVCDTCTSCLCANPVYCEGTCDTKALNHRRALIRFGVLSINSTYPFNGTFLPYYKEVYQFTVNVVTDKLKIQYRSASLTFTLINDLNSEFLILFLFLLKFNF
jgi:hypothetical protein